MAWNRPGSTSPMACTLSCVHGTSFFLVMPGNTTVLDFVGFRWVRAGTGGLILDKDFEATEARAVVQAWASQWVIDQFERLRDYERTHMTLPEEWRHAGFGSSRHLRLTKDELAQLADQLNAVLEP